MLLGVHSVVMVVLEGFEGQGGRRKTLRKTITWT